MSALLSFHLLRPWWLLLAIPAVSLWWILRIGADSTARWAKVMDPDILQALVIGAQTRRHVAPHDMLLMAWIVGIAAVAGPTWKREPSPFADARPPVMVVLRVTPSMKADDLPPSRLERAIQKLSDLVSHREGASTGLVAYSGSVHLVLPPTPDKDVVIAMSQALSPEIMPKEGDSLAQAVRLASSVLRDGRKGGSILVMADSVSSDQITAIQAASSDMPRPDMTIWAALPPSRLDAEAGIPSAGSALDAVIQIMSPDQSDVDAVARRLDRATPVADVSAEGERWQESGYWLTPLLALVALMWFRRGWVVGG